MLITSGLTLAALLMLVVWLRRSANRPDVLPHPDPIARREPFDSTKRLTR